MTAENDTEHDSKIFLEDQEDEGNLPEFPLHESNSTIASQLPKITSIAPKAVTVLQNSIISNSSGDMYQYSRSLSSYGSLDSLKVYNVQKGKRGVQFKEFQVYTSSSSGM